MKHRVWEALIAVLMALCLVFMGIHNRSLSKQIDELQQQMQTMESNNSRMESRLREDYERQFVQIREEIKKEASLFTDFEVAAALSGTKLVVDIRALPKEIGSDEALFFQVKTEDDIWECKADNAYEGSLHIPMTSEIEVSALFRSDRGIRQELLEKKNISHLFILDLNSIWGEYKESSSAAGYTVWLEPNWQQELLPFDLEKVKKAEFVIHNTGIRELSDETGADSSTWEQSAMAVAPLDSGSGLEDVSFVFETDFGERVEAVLIKGSNQKRAGFYVDMAEIQNARKDGMRYEVYFCLTLKDGTRYATPQHAAASFALTDKNSSSSSGDGVMYPVLQWMK